MNIDEIDEEWEKLTKEAQKEVDRIKSIEKGNLDRLREKVKLTEEQELAAKVVISAAMKVLNCSDPYRYEIRVLSLAFDEYNNLFED